MVANRGFDSIDSRSRLKLIEAAAALLEDEGYPAFSARRIAERAGLKPQLVHYYFRSMEALVVAVFQRSAALYFAMHDEALSGPRPLHALWELNRGLPEGKRMTEFVALARRYPRLSEEMRATGENFRRLQIEAIERVYAQVGTPDPAISPAALAMLLSAVARSFVIEDGVGVSSGHAELNRVIGLLLDRYEP